jgi:Resolvase, N terminal domain
MVDRMQNRVYSSLHARAVCIRVSSPKGQRTDSQRAELEAWLKCQRIKGVRWFEDREGAPTLRRDAFPQWRWPKSPRTRLG